MGVQSFNTGNNHVSFSFNSSPLNSNITNFKSNTSNDLTFTYVPVEHDASNIKVGFLDKVNKFTNQIVATKAEILSHFAYGVGSVFEDVVDGLCVASGAIVIYGSKAANYFGANIDTESMQNNLTDFVQHDYVADVTVNLTDNSEFIQNNSVASDGLLTGAELCGSIAGTVAIYSIPGGKAVTTVAGVSVSAAQGVGKGFKSASSHGASFDQAMVNAGVNGAISGVSKYGIGKIGNAAGKVGQSLSGDLSGGIKNVVTSEGGREALGNLAKATGKYGGSGAFFSASTSLAKNASAYSIYGKNLKDDYGNKKYSSYGDYFQKTDALKDIGIGAVSGLVSPSLKLYNGVASQDLNSLNKISKPGTETIKATVKTIPKGIKVANEIAHDVYEQANSNVEKLIR